MRTHIQIPEIHPANVGGRSKQGALKCPIVPGFVPISRHSDWDIGSTGRLMDPIAIGVYQDSIYLLPIR